jgi:drug/metabolite transporter (DMT)-like permease
MSTTPIGPTPISPTRPPATRRLPPTRAGGIGLALVTAVVSGVAVFVNDDAVARFPDATTYTTAKNLVAAVVICGLWLATGRRSRPLGHEDPGRQPTRRPPWGLIVVGIVGGSVPFVLFFEGLARSTSVPAAFIHKTLVVWVALLAIPLLGERFDRWHAGAVAALVVGQALLVGNVADLRLGAGEAMIVAATLLWAIEVVLARWLLHGYASLAVGAARMGVGVVLLLAWVAVSGRGDDLAGLAAHQWGWALLTGALLVGYVATWFAALARAQAVDVTAVLVAGALVTALLDAAVRGAALTPDVTALLLIALGTAAIAGRAHRSPEPARVPS